MIIVTCGYFPWFMPEVTRIYNLVQTIQEKEEWKYPVMVGWGRMAFCGGDSPLWKGQNDHEGVWGIKHYRLTTALIPCSSVPFKGEKVKEGEWKFAFSFSYASSTSNRQCITLISSFTFALTMVVIGKLSLSLSQTFSSFSLVFLHLFLQRREVKALNSA